MRQWLAAALAVAVAACAAPSRPTLGAAPDVNAALDARIFPPHYGSVPVQLSKPAYVALFEVIPGRGAALLYPPAPGYGIRNAPWRADLATRGVTVTGGRFDVCPWTPNSNGASPDAEPSDRRNRSEAAAGTSVNGSGA